MYDLNRQKGVALITVLLVVAILSWVVSYFIGKTQQNIELAGLQKDRVMAEIQADSLVDELMFLHYSKQYAQDEKYEGWNYRGQEFEFADGATVKFQDTQGKLSVINLNELIFKRFLFANGFDDREVSRFVDCLADWQDADSLKRLDGEEETYYLELGLPQPRNTKAQSITELKLICGFPEDEHKRAMILKNFNLYSSGAFNPLFADVSLIKAAKLPQDRKQMLMEMARSGRVKEAQRLFGINQSDMSLTTLQLSRDIELQIIVNNNTAQARRNIVFSYNLRYKPRPILQYWRWSE